MGEPWAGQVPVWVRVDELQELSNSDAPLLGRRRHPSQHAFEVVIGGIRRLPRELLGQQAPEAWSDLSAVVELDEHFTDPKVDARWRDGRAGAPGGIEDLVTIEGQLGPSGGVVDDILVEHPEGGQSARSGPSGRRSALAELEPAPGARDHEGHARTIAP